MSWALKQIGRAWTAAARRANPLRDQNGNTAITYALCVIPMMIVAGFAIDMNRQVIHQRKVQAAIDAAVLSAARHALKTDADDAELTDVANAMFQASLNDPGVAALNPLSLVRDGDEISLSVGGDLQTSMMQIVGTKTMPLGANATAVFGEPSELEIALVLDTSRSMQGSRLDALDTAATSLVDTLYTEDDAEVMMSIVPFSMHVNVGTDAEGASWLNVPAESSETYEACWVPRAEYESEGCVRESYACTRDGVPATCSRWNCPPGADPQETCEDRVRTHEWYGCVRSRSTPLNIEDRSYVANPVQGELMTSDWSCPSALQPLTNNADDLRAKLSSLVARSDTYIATGLTWGLRTLSPNAPFDQGQPFEAFLDGNGRKALVLMSDGANTRSPRANGSHWDNDADEANAITAAVCEEIKDQGIELYAISFEVDDATTEDLLKACASGEDNYYDAEGAAELQAAFDDIGSDLREIALAR